MIKLICFLLVISNINNLVTPGNPHRCDSMIAKMSSPFNCVGLFALRVFVSVIIFLVRFCKR